MSDRAPARVPVRLTVAFAAALALSPIASRPVAATGDLLPDLRIAQPYNLYLATTAKGRKKLRFGTIVWNVGQGPLEVRAGERERKVMQDVYQWIKKVGGGGHAYRPEGATAFYSGDGHNHWHIPRFVVVSLAAVPADPPPETGTPTARYLRKIGFCLVDLVRAPAELRPASSSTRARYGVSGCGVKSSTRLRMGISVGYGDDYKPFFAHQAIDVTGLPAGVYRLCATVNPEGMWRELRDNAANNSYWLDLEIDVEADHVGVVGMGETACDAPAPLAHAAGG